MAQGIIIPADNKAPLTAATFGTPADYNRAVDGWAEAVHIPHVGVTMHLNRGIQSPVAIQPPRNVPLVVLHPSCTRRSADPRQLRARWTNR